MFARHTIVPVAKRFPAAAIFGRAKNVALTRQDEVGVNREFKIDQTGFEQVNGPPGIDRPNYAFRLQRLDALHATAVEYGIAPTSDQRSVEIGAEQADVSRHAGTTLKSDPDSAIRRPCRA